jgi:transposase-like protein
MPLGRWIVFATMRLEISARQTAKAQYAFPGNGQMKPEQLEIARLKREVIKLKAERDILKKAAAYFAKVVDM